MCFRLQSCQNRNCSQKPLRWPPARSLAQAACRMGRAHGKGEREGREGRAGPTGAWDVGVSVRKSIGMEVPQSVRLSQSVSSRPPPRSPHHRLKGRLRSPRKCPSSQLRHWRLRFGLAVPWAVAFVLPRSSLLPRTLHTPESYGLVPVPSLELINYTHIASPTGGVRAPWTSTAHARPMASPWGAPYRGLSIERLDVLEALAHLCELHGNG